MDIGFFQLRIVVQDLGNGLPLGQPPQDIGDGNPQATHAGSATTLTGFDRDAAI